MVEEILDAQRPGCPREFFNIKVPKGHKYNPHNLDNLEMPFLRSRVDQRTGHSPNNPRQQVSASMYKQCIMTTELSFPGYL